MPTSRNDVRVQCPFYRYDERQGDTSRIACEGICGAETLFLSFGTKESCQERIDLFCCQDYVSCAVHRALMAKYEEVV